MIFYIIGSAQNQSNPATATASTPGQQQQQTQQQQTGAAQNGGQADYSAQWAEYYRSIGKIKEAEAIEAQMKAGKVCNALKYFKIVYTYLQFEFPISYVLIIGYIRY